MHGAVLCGLEAFVADGYGPAAWDAILADAGLPGRTYDPQVIYPDADLAAIVAAAAARTGVPTQDLVEAFGRALAPGLLRAHAARIDPAWRLLDVLEHVEEHIHAAIRRDEQDVAPPRLRAVRTAPNEVRIRYASRRGLCRLGIGIVHGLAAAHDEAVTVTEPTCTHAGDPACELVVRLVPRVPPAQVPGSAQPESGALDVGAAVHDA